MKVLLDTHVLIWAITNPTKLSPRALEVLKNDTNEVLVSAASAWEISTKVRMGKLPGAERLELEFVSLMDAAGFALLAIDIPCALRAGRLMGEHRDPFDRMIAAQALAEDMPVISEDAVLDGFGVRRVW